MRVVIKPQLFIAVYGQLAYLTLIWLALGTHIWGKTPFTGHFEAVLELFRNYLGVIYNVQSFTTLQFLSISIEGTPVKALQFLKKGCSIAIIIHKKKNERKFHNKHLHIFKKDASNGNVSLRNWGGGYPKKAPS